MSTLIKDIVIPDDRHITLDIELPPEVPVGDASITLTIKPAEKREHRLAELFGSGKDDEVWMADDFDAPLEDFGDSKAICASDEEKAELRAALNPKKITPALLELAGSLAGSETFAGDPVAIIREIRDEW